MAETPVDSSADTTPKPGEAEKQTLSVRRRRSSIVSPLEVEQSDGRDSGYASVTSSGTPSSDCEFTDESPKNDCFTNGKIPSRGLVWPQKTTLMEFDKAIPELTWNRFNDLMELSSRPLSKHLAKLNRRTKSEPVQSNLRFLEPAKRTRNRGLSFSVTKKSRIVRESSSPRRTSGPNINLSILTLQCLPLKSSFPKDHLDQLHFFGVAYVYWCSGKCWKQSSAIDSIAIKIEQSGGDECMATIGGLVEVTRSDKSVLIYGMTAGHVIAQDDTDSDDEFNDAEDEEEDKEEEHQDEQYNGEGKRVAIGEHRGPELFGTEFGSDVISRLEARKASEEIQSDSLSCSKLGSFYIVSSNSSKDGSNLDWALATIDNPPGDYLRSLYKKRQTLKQGDYGAWVRDVSSYEVYGHIVAIDDFGEAYVVPMCHTFQ
ncbi:hypothetical protein DL95DRAFT_469064 [Leptodontidium sp. 2 PMI_412]|nr:hypothetical protein DL95DRAFT_469064 [Leptodontidium sp. 2 PMI_412]